MKLDAYASLIGQHRQVTRDAPMLPRFSEPPLIIDGVWHFATKEDNALFVEYVETNFPAHGISA